MATNAVETAKQENGSRVFFESVIEKNKVPNDTEMLKVYDGYDESWYETYSKQVNALRGFLGGKGYVYSRDKGIMPYIEHVAKTKCGVSVKDRWNPMDIVLVRKNMETVVRGTIREITNIEGMTPDARLEVLNSYMRNTLRDRVMVGVSLKAISPKKLVANVETANMAEKGAPRVNINLQPGSLKCNLTLGRKQPYLFDTGELAFDLKTESGGSIHGQSRNFQYSKARNVIQTDLTPKGKDAGAKLGKVSSVAIDKFLQSVGLNRPPSATSHPHIPLVGNWTDSEIRYWSQLWDTLKTSTMIDFGEVAVYEHNAEPRRGFKHVLDYSILYETNEMDRSSAGRFSSKLIALEWAKIWIEIARKGKMKEWCTALYYGAKKEFSSKNGPFLKIY